MVAAEGYALQGAAASSKNCSARRWHGGTSLRDHIEHEAACSAFQSALAGPAGQLSREEYVEIVSALIKAYMEQEHFVEALDILDNIHSWQFSLEDSIRILLHEIKYI